MTTDRPNPPRFPPSEEARRAARTALRPVLTTQPCIGGHYPHVIADVALTAAYTADDVIPRRDVQPMLEALDAYMARSSGRNLHALTAALATLRGGEKVGNGG